MERPFQIIVLGNSNVGKTTLVRDKIEKDESTIGIDFVVKTVKIPNEKDVKIQFWDTAGQEIYNSIATSYYRKSECALLVFELCNLKSWNQAKKWFKEIQDYDPTIGIIFVGSKADLICDYSQEQIIAWSIIWNEAKEFSDMNCIKLVALSNYTGEGKEECLQHAIKLIRRRREQEFFDVPLHEPLLPTIKLLPEKLRFKKCC